MSTPPRCLQLTLIRPPSCPCPSRLPPACTPDGNGITYNEHINVALAVAMPDGGLITPVLKDADKVGVVVTDGVCVCVCVVCMWLVWRTCPACRHIPRVHCSILATSVT